MYDKFSTSLQNIDCEIPQVTDLESEADVENRPSEKHR